MLYYSEPFRAFAYTSYSTEDRCKSLLNKPEPCGTCESLVLLVSRISPPPELTPLQSNFCPRRRRVEPLLQVPTTQTANQTSPVPWKQLTSQASQARSTSKSVPFLLTRRSKRRKKSTCSRTGRKRRTLSEMLKGTNEGATVHLSSIGNSNSLRV